MFGISLPNNKCNHNWTLALNKELDSPYEQLIHQGESFDTIMAIQWGIELFRKTAVIIMTCDKCGKMDKTVVASISRTID